jgi:hypothetical protein
MNSMIDFRNAPFSFYVIRQPIQTYATKTHHAIVEWAALQRAEVDHILARPVPSDNVLEQGEAQRVAAVEQVLDDSDEVSHVHCGVSLTWLFN